MNAGRFLRWRSRLQQLDNLLRHHVMGTCQVRDEVANFVWGHCAWQSQQEAERGRAVVAPSIYGCLLVPLTAFLPRHGLGVRRCDGFANGVLGQSTYDSTRLVPFCGCQNGFLRHGGIGVRILGAVLADSGKKRRDYYFGIFVETFGLHKHVSGYK